MIVVWLPMYPGDARDRWDADVLPEAARQFWDGSLAAGRWFAQHLPAEGFAGAVAWDAFYVFDAEAAWDATPAPPSASGFPVVRALDTLRRELAHLHLG